MDNLGREIELLRRSDVFDAAWYLDQYRDAAALGWGAEEHYLRVGAALNRDPGPAFSTRFYLKSNPDVARSKLNPLVHYIRYGGKEGRAALPRTLQPTEFTQRIDVVVPVFNALEDVRICLETLLERREGCDVRIIVVNDGSDALTTLWLREFCQDDCVQLIEHPENRGYTKAINTGLRSSSAPFVITLNSDTIVTVGWLRGLLRCIASAPDVGIVGPLSNAASWQNVPYLYDDSGMFAVNSLAEGVSPDAMAGIVARASTRAYPRVPFVNGFCFMIKRQVIEAIGYMDEENFPLGYGEENDFCIRAADAGFALAIADDSYVFHSKSKSFGHERRKELSRNGSESLRRKHSSKKLDGLMRLIKNTGAMDDIRRRVQAVARALHAPAKDAMAVRILFLLPVGGGGGGAHSVVQEALELQRLGVDVAVAVKHARVASFRSQYADVREAASIFVGFDDADLLQLAGGYDVVVGTIYSSMKLVSRINKAYPHILPAYYVQDYEPLFFPEETSEWKVARDSYGLVSNAVLFAKTHWIINKVAAEHGTTVRKVEPSIDHEVYRPIRRAGDDRFHLSAMIRPQTPRRGAERTMRIFSRIAAEFGDRVSFHLFGCSAADEDFALLERNFEYTQHGPLMRPGVAAVLGRCDAFVDLSDYQAFGRTALEAMACGSAAVVTMHGGADEYAIDGFNALVVDPYDEESCFDALASLINDPQRLAGIRLEGMKTAARYSVHRAAVSELSLLSEELTRHRVSWPEPISNKVCLLPSLTKGGSITGSGHVRLMVPYRSSGILEEFAVRIERGKLPKPGSADVAIIQRDASGIALREIQEWQPAWRHSGGRVIYEIDDDLLDAEALRARGFTGDTNELEEKVRWLAGTADLVSVSTAGLAKKMAEFSRQIWVIPNCLDRELWKLDTPRDHVNGPFARDPLRVRVGYIGTPSHDADLRLVAGAMNRIAEEFGEGVEIEVVGGFERSKPVFGQRVGLPRQHDYPNFVNWLGQRVHWDIGIIPLAEDDFNRSKSNIKFLEYAALEMAIICSDVPAYRDVAVHGVNCLAVSNNEEAWYLAIKKLLENPQMRLSLAAAARKEVEASHTIESNQSRYVDMLRSCLAGAAEER